MSLGLVDRLAFHVGGVRGPLTEEQSASNDLLLSALKFLTSLVDLLHIWYSVLLLFSEWFFIWCFSSYSYSLNDQRPVKKTKPLPDQTQLVEAFLVTELAGVVNALYGLLLHQGVPSDGGGTTLPDNTIRFTLASLQLIHRLALVDLKTFQVCFNIFIAFRFYSNPVLNLVIDDCWSRRCLARVPPHCKFLASVRCQHTISEPPS